MTALELARDIGAQAEMRIECGLRIYVTIQDARQAWGRIDYYVTPVAGTVDGTWVSAERVAVFIVEESLATYSPSR